MRLWFKSFLYVSAYSCALAAFLYVLQYLPLQYILGGMVVMVFVGMIVGVRALLKLGE